MFNSLQPVKRSSRPNDSSDDPTTTTAIANGHPSRHKPSAKHSPVKSTARASKRRRLNADQQPQTDSHTRPTSSTKSSDAAPRRNQKLLPSKSLPVLPPTNTIDRYFTPSDSYQSDEPEKPSISLYDDIQRRVHDAETKSQDKRTLRSHDEGTRLKSDLSIYFPNYDEVINDTPKEPEALNGDTILIFQDLPKKGNIPASTLQAIDPLANGSASTSKKRNTPSASSVQNPQPTQAITLNGAQVVDFSIIEKSVPHHPQDPLTDAVYFKPHRRAERKEKQLRNIERERAMHEKVQLERLLDGLYGHDWLRVMGVTGVTESEALKFQAKREYFIREVKALVNKFKEWKEEEKRLKMGKDAAPQDKTEDEEDAEADEADDRTSRQPSSSEIDASAARQLQLEASGSAKAKAKQHIHPNVAPIYMRPPTPEGPFTSFFSKPHIRAAALGKNRHGRNTLAFGHPIPELDEQEFSPPADYITPHNLKESARRRRRMKRESLIDSSSK